MCLPITVFPTRLVDKVDTLDTVGWTLVAVRDLPLLANTLSLRLVNKVFQLTALWVWVWVWVWVCGCVSASVCVYVCARRYVCVRARTCVCVGGWVYVWV